jgi:hypothetical protein
MNPPAPDQPTKDQLIELFSVFNTVSGALQLDISRVMATKPDVAAQLKKQFESNEQDQTWAMDQAAYQYLKIFPLAQMNRTNMFCRLAALHSGLTGDPLMREVFEEVNRRVIDKDL